MSFRFPLLLVCLAIVPAALLANVWMREGGRVALPFDYARDRRGSFLKVIYSVADCLPVLLFAIVLIIVCGPTRLSEPRTKKRLTNIEICVDISGSMTAKFGSGSRYDASMAAIDEFLTFREGDAFGLTFFGNSVLHWTPLTTDASAIRCSPPFMNPRRVPRWFGGTEIGKALRACHKILIEREEGDRMIVLVSDGMSSDLSNGKDTELAQRMREDHVVVYAIHIGGGNAPDAIVNITSMTGGEVFVPGDTAGLKAVFHTIDEMQETELEKSSAETMDAYYWWCVIGLSLLGGCVFALYALRFTPW
jgi:Ca-activated chloride channel family protein